MASTDCVLKCNFQLQLLLLLLLLLLLFVTPAISKKKIMEYDSVL